MSRRMRNVQATTYHSQAIDLVPQRYPQLHIGFVNDALQEAEYSVDFDPVICGTSYNAFNASGAWCHDQAGDTRFLCPAGGDASASLQIFNDTRREYLETMFAVTVKDNIDVVYQLCEETRCWRPPSPSATL
ncbi:hypothetical protein GYMLUDRAFT_243545 [Collybiopsis luxurians FD-317 M1]|uniref:Uncharacterized protein n=1 Tax=Collybiopsis luxurians FD-317 M1 TaxID=944289 RepID=A0A0D0BCC2_9AGAR|nr:hypothetical protein GYMLUDRAFT_243545 [Collybiopsis luxurians FD-317 M1]